MRQASGHDSLFPPANQRGTLFMEHSTIHKRWRPRLRFSLRALMIAMTLVCVFLGYRVQRAREQRLAVAAIQLAGGRVRYDWQQKTLPPTAGTRQRPVVPGPKWLRAWMGDEYFQDVVAARWPADSTPDSANLAHLAKFPRLRELSICTSSYDHPDLGTLPVMPQLEKLVLAGWNITDGTLDQIGRQPALKLLRLYQEKSSPESIRSFAQQYPMIEVQQK